MFLGQVDPVLIYWVMVYNSSWVIGNASFLREQHADNRKISKVFFLSNFFKHAQNIAYLFLFLTTCGKGEEVCMSLSMTGSSYFLSDFFAVEFHVQKILASQDLKNICSNPYPLRTYMREFKSRLHMKMFSG